METFCIPAAVNRIKEKLFSPAADLGSLLPASAYDTAWVAMIPDPDDPTRPLFPQCLEWILSSQMAHGFCPDHDPDDHLNSLLPATLACLLAFKTWEAGSHKISKPGMEFLQCNMEQKLVKLLYDERERRLIQTENYVDGHGTVAPIELLYIDSILNMNNSSQRLEKEIIQRVRQEMYGSDPFQSPSGAACDFMMTGDKACQVYLEEMVQCSGGAVPPLHPLDEDLMKLCIVDHLERLGCSHYFTKEIMLVMDHLHRKWLEQEKDVYMQHDVAFKIYKDSLAFMLLRNHGYQVSPRRFCWFVEDEKMCLYIKQNYECFLGSMLSIYRASHLAFPEDCHLEKAKAFSQEVLNMGIASLSSRIHSISPSQAKLQQEIEHELSLQWLARMDHLEHRWYIERGGNYYLWIGKNAPLRILYDDDILQLAKENFMMRQSAYMKELEELRRWSKETGLSEMGFGRENTSYCYFAIASVTNLPLMTDVRKEVAKCAILITVADDFFDEKGSLHELSILTEAVQRWNGEGLSSHSKVIFTALNNLVQDLALKCFKKHGYDVKKYLQETWQEIFKSWLKEAEWSRSHHFPSVDEYIEVAVVSIAVEMIVLPACLLLSTEIPFEEIIQEFRSSKITKSLMFLCRFLNEIESYQKEAEAGKPNAVLLYLNQNPNAKNEDAIAIIKNMIKRKKDEFLKMVKSRDCSSDIIMPQEWKDLHLSVLKVFQMFFNSSNAFDSPTALFDNIKMAIYEPLMKERKTQTKDFMKKEVTTLKTRAFVHGEKIWKAAINKAIYFSGLNRSWIDKQRTIKWFHKLSCSSLACSRSTFKFSIYK